jgi:hypothetical protein
MEGNWGREVLSGWFLSNHCEEFIRLVRLSYYFYNCQEAGLTGYLSYEFGFWGLRIGEI